jgi:FkbM family methyltransferase
MITIDDLGVDPQIVKLDIQGNELAALKGATRTLTTSSPDLLVEITVAAGSRHVPVGRALAA